MGSSRCGQTASVHGKWANDHLGVAALHITDHSQPMQDAESYMGE